LTRPSHPPAARAAATIVLALPAHAAAAGLGERTPLHLSGAGDQRLSGSGGGGIVRTIVGLAIVVAVIYGLTWVLKQVRRSREERGRGSGLSSCAVVPLGPGRSLHLVRAGREYVLVGVADHAVMPIRTYTEAEAAALGLDVEEDEPAPARAGRGARSARALAAPKVAGLLDAIRERTVRS
jgi:flagellar protein FliO/FliZ